MFFSFVMPLQMSLWLQMFFIFYSYFVTIQCKGLDDRRLFVMLVKCFNCQDFPLLPSQVAQYLNLELPILEHVLLKLREEENREIQRIIVKSVYNLCVKTLLSNFYIHNI